MNELKTIKKIICLKMKMWRKLWNRGEKIQARVKLHGARLHLSLIVMH